MYRGGGNQGGNQGGGAPRGRGRGGPRGGARGGRGGRGGQQQNGGGGGGGGGGFTGFNDGGSAPAFVRGGAARGRGRGRGGRGGAGGGQGDQGGQQQGGTVNLELMGLPKNIDYGGVLKHVNECAQGARFIKLGLNQGSARLTVAAHDASTWAQLLNGTVIEGQTITVEMGGSAGRALNHTEKGLLQTAVRQGYNAQGKVLDLSALANRGLQFANFQSSNFTTELFNAIAQAAPDVTTINFDSNGIQTLTGFAGMIRVVPNLQNLSMRNNQIANVDQFEHLSGYRENLRELLLTGNSFFAAFTSGPGAQPQNAQQLDYSVYQQYISSIFPALKLLDTQEVNALINFDLPSSLASASATSLPPLQDSFFDSPTHKDMAMAFVLRYFEIYDRERQNRDLISVYADHAMFSLEYQTESKYADAKYTEQNRNIAALGIGKARAAKEVALLRTSAITILAALAQLPQSAHDPNSFVADVFKVTSNSHRLLLNITVRGQFREGADGTVLRHFHRTFLCTGPSQDASSKGWPVSILHDMLYIGAAVRLQTNNTVTPQQMQQPAYAVSPQPTLTAQDQQMVLMLAQQGGVDPATATSLLFEAQGDMNLALQRIGMMKQQMGM